MKTLTIRSLLIFALLWTSATAVRTRPITAQQAQNPRPVFDESFDHWPVETKINGRVFINRNLAQFETLDRMLRRVVKDQGIAMSAAPDDVLGKHLQELAKSFDSEFDPELKILSSDQIKDALNDSELLYIGSIESSSNLLDLRDELESYIQQGGSLIFDFRFAHLLGSTGEKQLKSQALNLLPDCMIASAFDGGDSAKSQLAKKLAGTQHTVGIGIENQTMLLLAGRTLISFGKGSVTIGIAGGRDQQPEFTTLEFSRRRNPNSRIDLTQWRRMAIDRSLDPFPPKQPKTPYLDNGTLYIVGGGGMPRGLMAEMIEKAGGIDDAKLVYVPCSESEDVGERQRTVEMWKRMGVEQATFIHTKDRMQANNDDDFLEPLKDATMIWFGGGRQWNFADSYYGTKAHRLMKEVLHRGGVIGGSSAGASIQGRFLARATPIGNTSILAPGYERGGLGFLAGVAIDQHFSQRGRQKDMTQLVEKYPQLLGIGIDEATALVVEKSKAKVIGRGKVFFYDRSQANDPNVDKDYVALPSGQVFDLATRKVVEAKE